ncbi:hypothetical protein H312_03309 [Anncaliia algerae PRA339]|uniref:Xaa-Pro aminopeptidase n=1 Tax=Anncaliia algerae PRA339 TaxID=1288291 RepID=A0A059EX20_9MICR|nr:hypothetical protein H312_03309 [Anncaliia algerae PRA339]
MNPLKLMINLLKKKGLSAYIIKISDPHLSEYISESDKYLEKVTGFTGSNGLAIISEKENVMYTDGRYFIQALEQLKDFKLKKYNIDEKVTEYLKNNFSESRIGIDKRMISYSYMKDLKEELKKAKIEIVHLNVNEIVTGLPERKFNTIIDLEEVKVSDFFIKNSNPEIESKNLVALFNDNPEINTLLLNAHNVTGSRREEKIKSIREKLEHDALFVAQLDTIAWILNLRGNDIPYSPVFYAYLVIDRHNTTLFTDAELNIDNIQVKKYAEIEEELKKYEKIEISGECNSYLVELIKDFSFTDDLNEAKSIKNDVELEGIKLAHILDGAALNLLFGWYEKNANKITMTEKDMGGKLLSIKQTIGGFKEESFGSICGSGKNAAIIHHEAGDNKINNEEILLLDSGSQYYFGTTDVTRTLHFGTPTKEEITNYTRVLKGFLLAKNIYIPQKTKLSAIDAIARVFLWQNQLNYEHGTSHGVGHFLNVHESPPEYNESLKPNQVLSIEPGYYLKDKYGIRIEDLVYVSKENDFLRFNSLTVVPFHMKLIDESMLTKEEINQINEYSKFVRNKLKDILKGTDGYDYLMSNTEKI